MLWDRSGNICAFPGCKKVLVTDESETDDPSLIGEEAHIVAKKPNEPRGNSTLTKAQRDKYDNLILLCSNHHKIIDDQPAKYTIELLKQYKLDHEEWVKSSLKMDKSKQKGDEIYSTYIDKIIELTNMNDWKGWTSYIFEGGHGRMYKEQYKHCRMVIEYILSRVWPKRYPKLEESIFNFKSVMNDFLNVFDRYAEVVGNGDLWTKKFYHIDEWNPEKYESLHQRYRYHIELVQDLTCELTRAANYLFDNVRETIYRSYRLEEGLLLIETGPYMDLSYRTFRLEYQENEKTDQPYPGLKAFMDLRKTRDLFFGSGVAEDYFPSTS